MNRRRRFLMATGYTALFAALTVGFYRAAQQPVARPAAPAEPPLPPDPAFPNPLKLPGADGLLGRYNAAGSFSLVARPVQHPILPDRPTRLLAYELDQAGGALHNPLLRVRTGTALRIHYFNAIDETSIIHWHGLKVDSNNDGHPHYAVPGGATYDYHFTVTNRAGTYWYHPHPHQLTGKQVSLGLAGFLIVEDEEELALQKALGLTLGETDVPLMIHDRRLDANGGLVYSPTEAERFHGHYGDPVLVNWTHRPHYFAATRIHRFRLLNASTARLYRLAFRHGERLLDFLVIGTDGGLLDRPHPAREVFLSPGERVDVLLDLRAAARGDAITLVSLPFDAMHDEGHGAAPHAGHAPGPSAGHDHAAHAPAPTAGHDHGGHTASSIRPDGAEMQILRIRVRDRVPYEPTLPELLARLEAPPESPFAPRLIVLDQARGRWRINGRTYRADETPITVQRGSVEVWDIRNVPPTMPHPMHIHGFQFRVLSRTGSPEQQRRLAIDASGRAASDLGWKDTVLVWPGETVRIVTDFSHPFLGDQVYMVHCHNLEHEDGGMMLNLKVRES